MIPYRSRALEILRVSRERMMYMTAVKMARIDLYSITILSLTAKRGPRNKIQNERTKIEK